MRRRLPLRSILCLVLLNFALATLTPHTSCASLCGASYISPNSIQLCNSGCLSPTQCSNTSAPAAFLSGCRYASACAPCNGYCAQYALTSAPICTPFLTGVDMLSFFLFSLFLFFFFFELDVMGGGCSERAEREAPKRKKKRGDAI
jgi:hypothetical protein